MPRPIDLTTLRKIGHLVTGTAGSQMVTLVSIPILTRLYSPDAFGLYGIFVAIVGVGSVFATLRYERGIVVADNSAESVAMFYLASALSLVTIPVVYLTLLACSAIVPSLDVPIHMVVVTTPFLLALAIGMTGTESALMMLGLKKQSYRTLGVVQVLRSLAQAIAQVGLGVGAWFSGLGLVIGIAIAPAVATMLLWYASSKQAWVNLGPASVSGRLLVEVAVKNGIYPKFMVWSAVCNSLTNYALVLLVGSLFSVAAAGAVFLAYRVLMMPAKLLARNISLVNLEEASRLTGSEMIVLYRSRLLNMMAVGSIPLAVIIVFAPWAFPVVFGSEWAEAGVLARMLAPAVFLQFVFMSFLTLFTALRAQKTYLVWSILRLVAIAAGLYIGAFAWGLYGAVIGFGIALASSYLLAHFLLTMHLRRAALLA